jgi:hypothetical protein
MTVAMRSAAISCILAVFVSANDALAAGGSLIVTVQDKATAEPTITRVEVSRADSPGRLMVIRKTVPAGIGVVLDRSLELSLPDSAYLFRMIRGPEYRIISGTFSLERTSLDEHAVELPRMVDMLAKGWTSGDCCVPASPYSLPLRMASEDLHLGAVLGHVDAKPIPARDRDDPPKNDPSWIGEDARHDGGLLFYGPPFADADDGKLPVERLVDAARNDQVRVAIENPFAWPLPVWLASGQIDGVFILGDWLRLDRKIMSVKDGRGPEGPSLGDEKGVGRWAERIYWNMLEAGLRIPPLAGSGDQGRTTPVGYNRLYVADPLDDYQSDSKLEARTVESPERWWRAAWSGQSVATNGPLLRPKLGGEIPGHVFQASSGEVLQLQPELTLTVRDPVEYLEVIHNGRVHYSARLDEFAKAGGVMPPMEIKESSWVTIRVVTLHEDHFRAAMSAPWYIDFDSQPRVTAEGVDFFRRWLSEYEQRLRRLPPDQLSRHVPYIRAARTFWAGQAAADTKPVEP